MPQERSTSVSGLNIVFLHWLSRFVTLTNPIDWGLDWGLWGWDSCSWMWSACNNCDEFVQSDENVPTRPLPPANNKGSTPSKPGTSFELERDEPVSKRPAGGARRESEEGATPARADEDSQSLRLCAKPGFKEAQNFTLNSCWYL